jgi:hypothetical protein
MVRKGRVRQDGKEGDNTYERMGKKKEREGIKE